MTQAEEPAAYKLTLEHRPNYLYALVEGERDSYEISRAYWSEIAEACHRAGYKKVLVEEELREATSIAEAFQIAAELPEMGFAGIRIAFVDRFADQSEVNDFSQLVALNRGLHSNIFSNTGAAEKWLLAG
jgi:hypothetical protein